MNFLPLLEVEDLYLEALEEHLKQKNHALNSWCISLYESLYFLLHSGATVRFHARLIFTAGYIILDIEKDKREKGILTKAEGSTLNRRALNFSVCKSNLL